MLESTPPNWGEWQPEQSGASSAPPGDARSSGDSGHAGRRGRNRIPPKSHRRTQPEDDPHHHGRRRGSGEPRHHHHHHGRRRWSDPEEAVEADTQQPRRPEWAAAAAGAPDSPATHGSAHAGLHSRHMPPALYAAAAPPPFMAQDPPGAPTVTPSQHSVLPPRMAQDPSAAPTVTPSQHVVGVGGPSSASSKTGNKVSGRPAVGLSEGPPGDDADEGIPDSLCLSTQHLKRLNTWQVHRMPLMQWEERFRREALKGEKKVRGHELGGLVTRYLCWRRAVFQGAGVFWLISLTIRASTLFISIKSSYMGFGNGVVFGVELGAYAQYFKMYIALEYAARSIILVSGYFAVFFAFCAAFLWRRFRASQFPAFASYSLGYFTPFLVYLVLSQSTVVEIEKIQQHLCRDLLNGTYREPGWPPRQLLLYAGGDTARLVGRLLTKGEDAAAAGKQAMGLSQAFGIPQEVCNDDPDTWPGTVSRILEEKGRLAKEDGTACRAAVEHRARQQLADAGLAPDVSQNITDFNQEAPVICDAGVCLPCKAVRCLGAIPALERSKAGVGGLEERSADLQESSKFYADPTCNMCDVSKGLWTTPQGQVTTWSCNTVCVNYWVREQSFGGDAAAQESAERAAAALLEHRGKVALIDSVFSVASVLDLCVDPDQVDTLRFFTTVAIAEWPWRMILGFRSTFQAFMALLPYLLSLMSGTITGAVVAKIIIPYSRIPALVLTCAISYSLPYIVLLTILFKQSVGDNGVLPAVMFGILTLIVFTPWQSMFGIRLGGTKDITEPQEHGEAQKALTMRLLVHYLCILLFGVLFCVWLSRWAELLEDLAMAQLLGLEAESLRELFFSEALWRRYGAQFVAIVINMFGFSKIASVTFADSVLWAVVSVDEANVDANQELHQEEQELALFAELHRGLLLREPKVAAQFDRIYREMEERKQQQLRLKQRQVMQADLARARGEQPAVYDRLVGAFRLTARPSLFAQLPPTE